MKVSTGWPTRGAVTCKRCLVAALLLCIAACATRPPSAVRWPSTTVAQAEQEHLTGKRVRWGGDVASVTNGKNKTCFEVISRPLARDGQPRDTAESGGRFMACADGVYPRGLYGGQQLTVVGTLEKPTVPPPNEHQRMPGYPQVAAESLYFWPEQAQDSSWRAREWPRGWEPWAPGSEGYWW